MTCLSVVLKTWERCLQMKMKTTHVSAESDPIPLYLPNTLLEMYCRKQTSQQSGTSPEIATMNVFLKKIKTKKDSLHL